MRFGFRTHSLIGSKALTLLSATVVVALLASCGGGNDEDGNDSVSVCQPNNKSAALRLSAAGQAIGSLTRDEEPSTLGVQMKSLKQKAADRVKPRIIRLSALNDKNVAFNDKSAVLKEDPGQPIKIGVARDVDVAASGAQMSALWSWTASRTGGYRAAVSVQSPGASGVRLGLQVQALPDDTVLRVYAPASDETVEITASEVNQTIERNLQAGQTGSAAQVYWLPTVMGNEAALEVELPRGVQPGRLDLALPKISHLQLQPTDSAVLLKASGLHEIDAMCVQGVQRYQDSVALMSYVDPNGDSYVCTGTLMNNSRQDFEPYFLSADHCISSQVSASSLETYWNYYAASCGSQQISSNAVKLSGGARLLYASGYTDTSFMRLNANPPKGALYAGWKADGLIRGDSCVFGIHNPHGGLQKFSLGDVLGYAYCEGDTCTLGQDSRNPFYVVSWKQGMTEGGSSGSALFNSYGQVIGQLKGGNASYENPDGFDVYGRLDVAFNELAQWLSPGN